MRLNSWNMVHQVAVLVLLIVLLTAEYLGNHIVLELLPIRMRSQYINWGTGGDQTHSE
jgi:hypothetical protein